MHAQKRALAGVLFALCLFASTAAGEEPRRCLYVSVIQDPPVLSSRRAITDLIVFARKARIGALFVQVYRANQAWFPSTHADAGPYTSCVSSVAGDPLAFLIDEAHAAGIEVHAWMNLLSLSANGDAPLLKKYGPGILTRNRDLKGSLEEYKIDSQYFLEPGDPLVRSELADIVEEVLRTYPGLDGIQFDYIRYPDRHPAYGYTDSNVSRYLDATGLVEVTEGSVLWEQWKRDQVTGLLEQLVARTRAIRPAIRISTTGCAPYARAYLEAFQDWPSWLERGLVDFVTVMAYATDTARFGRYLAEVKKHAPDLGKVAIAIGAYEMAGSPETLSEEYSMSVQAGARMCVFFHYGSLAGDPALGNVLLEAGSS